MPPSGNVTFLFTDMCGSTRLARLLGPESFEDNVLLPHERRLVHAVADNHGTLLQTTGDGVFAAFERAAQALAAAEALQQGLRDDPILVDSAQGRKPIAVRAGLHRSERELTPEGEGASLRCPHGCAEI